MNQNAVVENCCRFLERMARDYIRKAAAAKCYFPREDMSRPVAAADALQEAARLLRSLKKRAT